MAGHSKFKNIQHRKGAQDKKRAKFFSKLTREIIAAAKQGQPSPDANPRLRTALTAARAANMPKDNIQRALARSSHADQAAYESVRYEGFAPGGIAIIIETLTDNRNRTASSLRHILAKAGGRLGETNSAAFLFRQTGEILCPRSLITEDKALSLALEAGADDCSASHDDHLFSCQPDRLHEIGQVMENQIGTPLTLRLAWRPIDPLPPKPDDREALENIRAALEDHDDVQQIYHNAD